MKKKKGEQWKKGFQQGVQDEWEAWMSGKRCLTCGKKKEQILTTDTCKKCFEEG